MAEYDLGEINIDITDPKSINDAIMKVTMLKSGLNTALKALQEYLLDQGVTIVRQQIVRLCTADVAGGDLYSSVERGEFEYDESTGKGVAYITVGNGLKTSKENGMTYAVFVEYGTGIYKEDKEDGNKQKNPTSVFNPKVILHNKTEEKQEAESVKRQVFYSKRYGKWYSIVGQRPKHFMQSSFYELRYQGNIEAARLIAKYLPHELG